MKYTIEYKYREDVDNQFVARVYKDNKHLFSRISDKSFTDARERALESLRVIARKRPFEIPPTETINILGTEIRFNESNLCWVKDAESMGILSTIKEANEATK